MAIGNRLNRIGGESVAKVWRCSRCVHVLCGFLMAVPPFYWAYWSIAVLSAVYAENSRFECNCGYLKARYRLT